MELIDAIDARRNVRNFSDRPIPASVLDAVIESAFRAPSAGNTQGLELVVLQGPAETAVFWQTSTTEDWWDRNPGRLGLQRAPVVLLPVCGATPYVARYAEPDKAASGLGDPAAWPVPFWLVDAAFATMILILRAVDTGLGAAFIGIFRGEGALCAALGIPQGFRPLGAVLLGYPAPEQLPSRSAHRAARRRDERVHRGRW